MQEIITIYDFILLPVYLIIFYLIVRRKSKKYAAIGLKKYFILAFWLRMAGAIGYSLLIQYYYGYGDSFGFYLGGNIISGMIQQDITAIKYLFMPADDIVAAAKLMGFTDEQIPVSMPIDSNVFIMKLCSILSLFTFNKYLLIAITFGFFSFIGIWKLFFVFYQLNEKKQQNLLAFFILFLPSLWFWGSGLIKEPICVGFLGIIIYLFHKNFIQKNLHKRDILIMLLLLFFLTIVKSYITAILLISFLVIIFYSGVQKIRIKILRYVVIVILLAGFALTLISMDLSSYINLAIENSVTQLRQMQRSYQLVEELDDVGSKAGFKLSEFDASLGSLLAKAPAVIGTCLYRPFVWEARKIIIFFASLETLFTLLMTLYVLFKTRIFNFFRFAFGRPLLLFCFIFSLLFAAVIGYTTFNFGTMIRYKIIFLPFYFFVFIQVYRLQQEKSLTLK